MYTLLLGGARSGKSALALELAREHAAGGGGVAFVATSPRIVGDDDLAARIDAHRRERPPVWTTIEEQHDLVAALDAAGAALAIVDCLTLWVSNLLWRGDDDTSISERAAAFAAAAAARGAPTIVISNEVGLGVHPPTEVGRRYRDVLGRVNQTAAATADHVLLMVAGRALELNEPRALL